MAHVQVYTTPVCPYCVRAKRLLNQKGVTYDEINVAHDTAMRSWLVLQTGLRTVPQIFIDGKAYGGFDELAALERQGKLDALLAG